ncbi:MAG: acyltransferase family protein [Lachnospiraceae bacterium]|nr:acyltransferase family protein [Lachnospiraceae bacterium]
MEQSKRLQYLDLVKAFGIILVVLGHIEYISDPLRTWLSSFHMPVFFIVSGILLAHKQEDSLSFDTLLKKKTRGILIPYFWFSLLYFFIDIFNVWRGKITELTFVKDLIASATFYGVSVLWFLPALFIAEIGFLFLKKKLPDWICLPVVFILAILSYLVQLSVKGIYTAHESSLVITTLIDFLRVFLRGFIAMSFVGLAYTLYPLLLRAGSFSLAELITGIVMFLINMFLSQINGCVDFHYLVLGNVPLFYLCAFLGSASLILISKNIRMKYLDPLLFFGRNSLIVMATHVNTYVLYAAILIAWQIDTIVTRAKHYVFLFNIMAFTFLFEALIIVIIHRFFPFMLGKGTILWRKKD